MVVALGDPSAQLGNARGDGVLEGLGAALGHHALHRFHQLFLGEGNGVGQAARKGRDSRIGGRLQNGAHERRRGGFDAVGKQFVDGELGGGFSRGHGCLRSLGTLKTIVPLTQRPRAHFFANDPTNPQNGR